MSAQSTSEAGTTGNSRTRRARLALADRPRAEPGEGLDRRLLARAEAALAGLTPQFFAMAADELLRMQQALDTACARPDAAAGAWQAMFAAAHDLRDIGSTFNYQLVSRFSHSLCRYLQGGTVDPAVAQAHLEALRAVIGNRVKGDGGPLAHRIGRALEALVGGRTAG